MFLIKNFFSKYEQLCSFLRIWSYSLKKSIKAQWPISVKNGYAKSIGYVIKQEILGIIEHILMKLFGKTDN